MSSKLIEDFLRPFTPAQVSMVMTLAVEMQTYGLTPEDVITCCTEYFMDMGARKVDPTNIPTPGTLTLPTPPRKYPGPPTSICPECGASTRISAVNVSKCTAVGGEWRTSIECGNKECRYTELSLKSIAEWRVA